MPWDPDAPLTERENAGLTDYYGNPLPGHPNYETPEEKREREEAERARNIGEDEGDDQVQASSDPIEIAWDALLKNIGLL